MGIQILINDYNLCTLKHLIIFVGWETCLPIVQKLVLCPTINELCRDFTKF